MSSRLRRIRAALRFLVRFGVDAGTLSIAFDYAKGNRT
jgi:hypothetical protein